MFFYGNISCTMDKEIQWELERGKSAKEIGISQYKLWSKKWYVIGIYFFSPSFRSELVQREINFSLDWYFYLVTFIEKLIPSVLSISTTIGPLLNSGKELAVAFAFALVIGYYTCVLKPVLELVTFGFLFTCH